MNRHMELLLHLEAVTSIHNLRGLRQLFDAVESNVRGLKALGVPVSSYGGLLSPILMSRLPSELRLIVSRELSEDAWDVEVVMGIVQREIEARERSAGTTLSQGKKPTSPRPPPTALSLTQQGRHLCNPPVCTAVKPMPRVPTRWSVTQKGENRSFGRVDVASCVSVIITSVETVGQWVTVPSAVEDTTHVYVRLPTPETGRSWPR